MRLDSGVKRAIREANLEGVAWTKAEIQTAAARARSAAEAEQLADMTEQCARAENPGMKAIGAGMALMEQAKYAEAADAFREGLAQLGTRDAEFVLEKGDRRR